MSGAHPPDRRPNGKPPTLAEPSERKPKHAQDIEDDRLLTRAQHGETGAFELLYQRHFDRVYAYARGALRDAHEAEDIAQEVFAKVLRALPHYEVREHCPFRAWLFRVARNAVVDAASGRRRLQLEEPISLDQGRESPDLGFVPGVNWLPDDDLAMLISRLPLSQRQVILLRYLFELTTEDIAAALDRTPMAVRMLEHRAMRALEARLTPFRHRRVLPTRSPMLAWVRPSPVVSSRRLAIAPACRTPAWSVHAAAAWRR